MGNFSLFQTIIRRRTYYPPPNLGPTCVNVESERSRILKCQMNYSKALELEREEEPLR